MNTHKRVLAMILFLAMFVSLMAGCSSSGSSKSDAPKEETAETKEPAADEKEAAEPEENAAEEEPTEPAENASSDDKLIIKVGHSTSEDSVHVRSAEFFKQRVEELSNGAIEVQIYPNSVLGDQAQQLEAIRSGALEMTFGASTNLSAYSDLWSVFGLPYLFNDRDHMHRALADPEVAQILADDIEPYGFKILGYYYMGARSIINGKGPIEKPEDLKGLKIRCMPDPILAESINAMGATGTTLAWGEVYSALQQGVLDGFEQSAPLYVDCKAYEVVKYMSLTEQFIIPNVDVIGVDFFNSLSPENQQIVLQAAKEAEENFKTLWDEYEEESDKVLADNGVIINEVDKEPFIEAVQVVYDKYASQFDPTLLEKIAEAA